MYDVGSRGFVYDGEVWCGARVILQKKGGWHLLVTDNGKEINRQAERMYATPRDVFNYLVTQVIVRARLSKKEDSFTPSIIEGRRYCSAAAYWFVRLSGCYGEPLNKLHDLWAFNEEHEELQSLPS